ncbi:MAG: metalloregulator ArsR/SmtB family transcription factor [Spirochaetes bacterium]|nr:metalloregulator ArsR/SmtB family transcription factor [Spirochaetota bacterium]
MTEQDTERLQRRAGLLKALAHPSRLLIMEMLEARSCHVGELREAIGADLTTVSKHLAVLKKVGLVSDEKRGTYSWYRLRCNCVSHMIDCIEDGLPSGKGQSENPAGAATLASCALKS